MSEVTSPKSATGHKKRCDVMEHEHDKSPRYHKKHELERQGFIEPPDSPDIHPRDTPIIMGDHGTGIHSPRNQKKVQERMFFVKFC